MSVDPTAPAVPRGTSLEAIIAAVARAGDLEPEHWTHGQRGVRGSHHTLLRAVVIRLAAAAGRRPVDVGGAIGMHPDAVSNARGRLTHAMAAVPRSDRTLAMLAVEARAIELLAGRTRARQMPVPATDPAWRRACDLRRLGWTIPGIARQLGRSPWEVAVIVGEPEWQPARRQP